MIVVCGNLAPVGRHDGLAVGIARRAAASVASVQVIGIVADGPDGDRQLIRLASAGVGHSAVLRTAPRALEPADVELALHYLPDIRVVIAAAVAPSLVAVMAEGAAYAGAGLILIGDDRAMSSATGLQDSTIVLQAPPDDPDGTFAGFVGALAVKLDGGADPGVAWTATVRDLAADPVTPGPGRRGRAPAG